MAGDEATLETQKDENQAKTADQAVSDRLFQLPLSRIKHIIKSDPDVSLASQEAVVSLAKAAELFIQMLAKDAAGKTLQSKRKTLQRKDLDVVLDTRDAYAFLEEDSVKLGQYLEDSSSDSYCVSSKRHSTRHGVLDS